MSAVDAVRVSMTDVNSDLEALMDKYDDAEKPKPQKKAATTSAGGPSKDDVQDMELKILQGNNDAEASQKAAQSTALAQQAAEMVEGAPQPKC